MKRAFLNTRSTQYFLKTYGHACLDTAVEFAAERERKSVNSMIDGFYDVPVNVLKIAEKRRIKVLDDKHSKSERDALMVPTDNHFRLFLNPHQSQGRQRFTLAHEIGHTLFYIGMKHQIGRLEKAEIDAEERICNNFASALLMPKDYVNKKIRRISPIKPWKLHNELEGVCRVFEVSLSALISRMCQIRSEVPFPCIILCIQHRQNSFTGKDRRLRVISAVSSGEFRNMRTWSNKSIDKIGLQSVHLLFSRWKQSTIDGREVSGGKYALDSSGNLTRVTADSSFGYQENVRLSTRLGSKWSTRTAEMLCSSCLYASKEWTESKAYILSVLSPLET